MNSRRYRSGFSLIELLIVVAIIAALIGVAVPYFQSNLAEAQVTKAKQDLDTIRNAINLYESRYRPLVGADLKQILGQTMQDIPKDPWGADYYMDANLGILWSYGADGQPGGEGGDQDQVFKYKPPLQIRKAEYEGPFGPPKAAANKLTLTFTKPFTASGDVTDQIVLVKDMSDSTKARASQTTFKTLAGGWTSDVTKAADGIIVLKPGSDAASTEQSITPTMGIDILPGSGQTVAQTKIFVLPHPKSVIINFGSTQNSSATTTDVKLYPGYPDGYFDIGATPADNTIGVRIERKS